MRTFAVLLSFALSAAVVGAQAAGLRGAGQEAPLVQRLPAPDPATAERLITVEAVAEVRVVPSRLRVVFAASTVGATASTASASTRALLADVRAALRGKGFGTDDADVDFIAAMPVYDWRVEQQNAKNVAVERRVGVRAQYNLHVSVPDEAAALAAIEAATAGDGVDVLAVDYWSEELAQRQTEALQQALSAAQQKAKLLLSVFPEPPQPVNVHESTHVLFPQQLYQTLPRAEDSATAWYPFDDLPRVPASRPLLVYYRGLFGDLDAPVPTMPGRREIEIVSTVRLYYAAPGRPAAK